MNLSSKQEIAGNFKAQGNDYFKEKRYREALGFYGQAVDAKPTNNALLESVLLNRAACNLELREPHLYIIPCGRLLRILQENFGSVLRDCSNVIAKNPKAIKAYYRSAMALIALERAVEAIDCCKRALVIDPTNIGMKSVLEKSNKLKEKQDEKERQKAKQAEVKANERKRIEQALKVSTFPARVCHYSHHAG